MKLVKLMGRCTAGGTAGRTVGLDKGRAVVVGLPAWGPAGMLSSVTEPPG